VVTGLLILLLLTANEYGSTYNSFNREVMKMTRTINTIVGLLNGFSIVLTINLDEESTSSQVCPSA